MKRCALIISGQLRTEHNIENIVEKIILPNDKYTFDIFIVSWNISTYQISNHILEKDTEILLLEKYKPIKMKIKNKQISDDFYHSNNLNKISSYSNWSQFYTCEEGMKLVETYETNNNIKYDLFIRYRFDLFLTKPILLNEYNLDKIHGVNFPGNCDYGTYWNDWLFFGDEKNEEFYENIF